MAISTAVLSSEHFQEDIIFIDIEATGLHPSSDRVVQLAMLKIQSDGQIKTFNSYFNPFMSKSAQMKAFQIHHISPDMLSTKSGFNFYIEEINDFIGETKYLCAHNVWSDWNYLLAEFTRAGQSFRNLLLEKDITLIDTNKLSIKAFPSCQQHSLESLSNYLNIIVTQEDVSKVFSEKKDVIKDVSFKAGPTTCFHDAMTDTLATKQLFLMTICKLSLPNKNDCQPLSLKEFIDIHSYSATKTDFLRLLDQYDIKSNGQSEINILLNGAKTYVSSLKYNRGKLIKDLSRAVLQKEISYLEQQSMNINKQREMKLRMLILKYYKL